MIKLFKLFISLSKERIFSTLSLSKDIKQFYVLQENYDILIFYINL
jgi:hypothetical protein